jgi:hypothetical protein
MKYVIHTCPDRLWYVEDFLVPSMKKQGINAKDIIVDNDAERMGTLKFYLKSFSQIPKDTYGTWHLQDDVVLSKHFAERTKQYDDGLVNGFCSNYCKQKVPGVVKPDKMWYSFPCMRIPNILIHDFLHWFYNYAIKQQKWQHMVEANKFIDAFFMYFIKEQYPNLRMRNVSPNLVDHVDYLLGGSTINAVKFQTLDRRASFWNEPDVIRNLEWELSQYQFNNGKK